jgi:serine/threonine protein kinase
MGEPTLRQIGDYQLVGIIGKGGMGVVYRALDNIGRTVAIKMLRGAYAEDKDLLKRFYREAQSTGNLQHKNIVTVHALGDQDGTPYLVMEFLDGRNLSDLMAERTPMPLVEKLGIIIQVCDGLSYAHQRELVHRDIKPANILVLKDGVVKIVDFGIVRVGVGESLTHTGQLIGSMYYMSPEQINGNHIDCRSDLFSTGVMLYQLLTGSRPFEGADAASTFKKIALDSVPPLSKYLPEYPAGLDEVMRKSLAKNPDERYQSAEELAFDLCHIQDNLKRGMSNEFLKRAIDAIKREKWEVARNHLQEILKLDRQHSRAYELLREVRQSIQSQQRTGQIIQLRSQAEVAVAGKQFEEALACIDAALRMDPDDLELAKFRKAIEQLTSKAKALRESLQRGEAALYAGDLDEAEESIRAALEVDANNTDALALGSVLTRELAERSNRAKVREYINEARQKITNQDFTSALELLQQAGALDPSDSNVRELHNWASRGHEQERRRKEIDQLTDQIRQTIHQEELLTAFNLCESAALRFPDEPSFVKLKDLAESQHKIKERRRFVEQQSILARRSVDEGTYEAAIRGLQAALQQCPGEPNLEALLSLTRLEHERKCKEEEQEENKRRRAEPPAAQSSSPAADPKSKLVTESVGLLRRALDSGEPVNNLMPLAKSIRDIAAEGGIEEQLGIACNFVLLEFEARLRRWDRDSSEIEQLKISIEATKALADMLPFAERAHFLAEQHANDDHFKRIHSQITGFVNEIRSRRDAAVTRASELLASMFSARDLASLASIQKEIQEIGSLWPAELRISSVIEQASGQFHEASAAKTRVLAELGEIEVYFRSTRSRGEISLQLQQSTRISAECLHDDEIADKLKTIRRIAEESLQRLDLVCSELKNTLSATSAATSSEEVDSHCATAREIACNSPGLEEIDNLVNRVVRRSDERRKSHTRILDNLEALVLSVAKAQDRAELDLIKRQCQDLIKEWRTDAAANACIGRLEVSVQKRLRELHEMASSGGTKEQERVGRETAQRVDSKTILFPSDRKKKPAPASTHRVGLAGEGRSWGKFAPRYIIGFGSLILAAFITLPFFPKSINLYIIPADQSISVDGSACPAPCVRKLTPGRHQLEAMRPGFEDLRQTIKVPLLGSVVPVVRMRESPIVTKALEEPPKPSKEAPIQPPEELHQGKLSIRTTIPGASVYVDGRLSGHTSANGQLTVETFDGPHEVRVEKQGFQSVPPKTVNVGPNAGVVVPFKLEASPASVKPAEATVIPTIIAPPPTKPGNAPLGPEVIPPLRVLPSAPVVRLTSTPDKISEGETVTLAWQTENANDVAIEGIGAVGTTGSRQFSLERSTTYRLTAKGPGGQVTESLRVEVISTNKTVAASSSETERQGIQSALQRYKDAYESESLDDMKKAWPSISKAQEKSLKGTFNEFNAIRIALHCQDEELHISADDAWLNCRQVSTYTQRGKKQPEIAATARISLRKHSGIWVISSVQFQ